MGRKIINFMPKPQDKYTVLVPNIIFYLNLGVEQLALYMCLLSFDEGEKEFELMELLQFALLSPKRFEKYIEELCKPLEKLSGRSLLRVERENEIQIVNIHDVNKKFMTDLGIRKERYRELYGPFKEEFQK